MYKVELVHYKCHLQGNDVEEVVLQPEVVDFSHFHGGKVNSIAPIFQVVRVYIGQPPVDERGAYFIPIKELFTVLLCPSMASRSHPILLLSCEGVQPCELAHCSRSELWECNIYCGPRGSKWGAGEIRWRIVRQQATVDSVVDAGLCHF